MENAAHMLPSAGEGRDLDGAPIFRPDEPVHRRRRADIEHDLFATIVEDAFSEILVFDAASLNIVLANKSARTNLGYSAAEIVGKSITDLKVEFSAARLKEIYRPILEGETTKMVVHTTHRRKDGTFYPVEVHSRASLFDKRLVIFQIVIDQTEIKRGLFRADLMSSIERDAAEAKNCRELLAKVLARLSRQLGCQLAHAYVWNKKACWLESSGLWHVESAGKWQVHFRAATQHMNFRSGSGLPGQVHAQRGAVILERLDENPTFLRRTAFENTPFSTGFGLPVMIGNEVEAVLEFFSVEKLSIDIWPELTQSLGEQISRLYERKRAEESANESRERFEAAVNGADVGLWDYNYKSNQFYLSPRCREILNIPDNAPNPTWKMFGERIHPKDVRRTTAAMTAHMLKRTPYDVEYRYRLANGDHIWLHSKARGVWDDEGNVVRTAGTIEDISREKEADKVQREVLACIAGSSDTAAKISQALDRVCAYLCLEVAIVSRITNDSYEVLYRSAGDVGPALNTALPLADTLCSDVYSSDVLQAFPDLEQSPVATHPARTRSQTESYIGIAVFVKGVRFGTLSFSAREPRKIFDDAEISMVRLLGRWVGEEIGRASDVAELIENDVRITAKLASSADALLTVDKHGRIEEANPAAAKMFWWDFDELRQMSIGTLLPTVKAFSQTDGRLIPVNLRQDIAVRKDGRRIAILLNITRTQVRERDIYTVAISDLTAVKQAEAAKGEFISVVSHELRTPLTSIKGALGLIASQTMGPLTSEAIKLTHIAQRNCERLLNLVNDILSIEKFESGQFDLSLQSIDLNELLADTVAANSLYAAKFAVVFDLSLAAHLPPVIADRDRLMQVMANLLSNAAKFTKPGTTVSIATKLVGKYARISVRDRGNGIPDSVRDRIFEKFTQGESANTRGYEGSGLGLCIARQLVELMNGEIEFTTEAGVGTEFCVSLPVTALVEGRSFGPATLVAGPQTAGNSENKEKCP